MGHACGFGDVGVVSYDMHLCLVVVNDIVIIYHSKYPRL